MKDVVLTAQPARHSRDAFLALEADGIRVTECYGAGADSGELAHCLRNAWGVVAGLERYGPDVLAIPSLRMLVRFGVGSENVDLVAATAHNVAVCTTAGANAEAVADMTVALMLCCLRRILELDTRTRRGLWRPDWVARDLAGARVGIVGLGAVGRAVARRLAGFGCRLLAVETNPDGEFCARHSIELASLHAILPEVDILTLHAPTLPETTHMIGARELALLPPTAVIVNTSRGNAIDERALERALREGTLAGAGLDVFQEEPLGAASALAVLPNVVLTAHVASSTEGALKRTAEAATTLIKELAAGRIPSGCLNPQAWPAKTRA